MKSLIFAEWRRFQMRTIIFALAHTVLLLLLSRVTNLLELGTEDQGVMLGAYMLCGLALALIQMGGYSKPSQWLWLIHRPLPASRIFGGLAMAAVSIVGVAIVVPLVITLATYELFSTHVVDSRNYGYVLLVFGFVLIAWLAGAHSSISRHKLTAVMVAAPVLLVVHVTSVWWLLLPLALCLAWFTYITVGAFRADRAAPIKSPSLLLLTALPLQIAFLVAAFHLGRGLVDAADYFTRPPLTIDNQPVVAQGEGDLVKAMEAIGQRMSRELLTRGLADSADPRAEEWRAQIPLLETTGVTVDMFRFPVPHQAGNQRLTWWDEKRGIEWTFSHDRMMFHGRNPRTGEHVGWWGRNGVQAAKPFDEIPLQNLSESAWFGMDAESQTQREQYRLVDGEKFLSSPHHALGHTFFLTTDRMLAFRRPVGADVQETPPDLAWEFELPASVHLSGAHIAELMDGWLVSLYYYNPHERHVQSWQQVFFIDDGGATKVVGDARAVHGIGINTGALGAPALPQDAWWVSPPLHSLVRSVELALDHGQTRPTPLEPLPRQPGFYQWAAGLMLLSTLVAFLWCRRIGLGASRRRLWVALCAVLSLPALLSLFILEPRALRR